MDTSTSMSISTKMITDDPSHSRGNGKPLPLTVPQDDTSVTTTTTGASNSNSESSTNIDDIPSLPDDDAAYLKQELHDRVQTEPELFGWIQKAALDGMWYVTYSTVWDALFIALPYLT